MSWTEDFQRQVVASALRGDLLLELPLSPDLFGSSRENGPRSPRQRVVELIVKYFNEYGDRPSAATFTQVVADAGALLGPEERQALEDESVLCLATDPPEDPRFVRDRVRAAVEFRELQRGLLQAADLLKDERSLEAVRELLGRCMEPVRVASESRNVEFLAGAEERARRWRMGDEYGERISTGFAGLDAAFRGGPTRRESIYFLAPPKGAKTASLLTVAVAALRRQLGVYMVTYEMQAIRMALRADRLLSASSKEELEDDMTRLERAIDGLRASGAAELYIDEEPPQRPNAVANANRRVQEIRRKGGRVDVVIFDYLNIMGASRTEREKRHELARVSRDISSMAKELDVLTWSAALVNRQAVNKRVVRKTDIAEAFEVVAVADGMIAICATAAMLRAGLRRFRVVASREEADEINAGDYRVDFSRMLITPADSAAVDAVQEEEETGMENDDAS
jgi:KaiC/GvpD/RAD55 family RecA-like ATPase